MPRIDLFLDSSALFAGIASSAGAARVLLRLADAGEIRATVSEQVIAEVERALARKLPAALPDLRRAIKQATVRIVRDPTRDEVQASLQLIAHAADVPIVLAAMRARAGFLVTLNRRHFIDDPKVARLSGMRIGSPGDALAWVRSELAGERRP